MNLLSNEDDTSYFLDDDDYAISDDEVAIEKEAPGSESDDEMGPRGKKKNEDSDFVLEEDDSGSDWGKKGGGVGGNSKSKAKVSNTKFFSS